MLVAGLCRVSPVRYPVLDWDNVHVFAVDRLPPVTMIIRSLSLKSFSKRLFPQNFRDLNNS